MTKFSRTNKKKIKFTILQVSSFGDGLEELNEELMESSRRIKK